MTAPGRQRIRSPKAGCPPEQRPVPPRVRRRQKTARTAVRKDTMVSEAPVGPRILWGRTQPKIKKG
jgi:hypothetical protein